MAKSSSPKKHYACVISGFLTVFLLSIFLFNQRSRSLQPSVSFYRYIFPQTRSPSPLSNSSLHQELLRPYSPVEPSDSDVDGSLDSDLISESEQNPVSNVPPVGSVADKGGDLTTDSLKKCDLYMGAWVKDEGYPIYAPGSCPYVDKAFDCQNNGRPDADYLKWRWKPDGCDLPRWTMDNIYVRYKDPEKETILVTEIDSDLMKS